MNSGETVSIRQHHFALRVQSHCSHVALYGLYSIGYCNLKTWLSEGESREFSLNTFVIYYFFSIFAMAKLAIKGSQAKNLIGTETTKPFVGQVSKKAFTNVIVLCIQISQV